MKEKKKRLLPFTIKMIILFNLVLLFTEFSYVIMYGVINTSKYGMMMLFESIVALVMLLIMLLSGNKYVFMEDRERLGSAIKKGIPILIVSFLNLFLSIISLISEQKFDFLNFLSLLFLTICIGLFEEFLCRGWLQNEFIERFGKNRSGIIKSIIISAFFFGLMHATNVFVGQNLFDTIMQVLQTTSVGLLFGALYYRTKNIWACVFLHAFYDFCLMLADINYIKDPIITGGTITSILSSIFICLFYIFGALKLIQKSDIRDDNQIISETQKLKEIKTKKYCNIMMIVSFICVILIGFIPDDTKYTEFNYAEKEIKEYTAHYPRYEDYSISYINNGSEQINLSIYKNDNNNIVVKNINTKQEVVIDYEVYEYLVIDDDNSYGILIYTYDEIYYADLNKGYMNNTLSYLESIKNNFKKYDIPELQDAGYITVDGDRQKYPYLLSVSYDKFIIMNNDIYLLK